MNINEAIERLKGLEVPLITREDQANFDALMLGIEALKEVKKSRDENYIGDTGLLPGETEY